MDTNEFKPEKRMKKHLPSRKQRKNILELSLKQPDVSVKPLHFNVEKIHKMVLACLIKRHTVAEWQS